MDSFTSVVSISNASETIYYNAIAFFFAVKKELKNG